MLPTERRLRYGCSFESPTLPWSAHPSTPSCVSTRLHFYASCGLYHKNFLSFYTQLDLRLLVSLCSIYTKTFPFRYTKRHTTSQDSTTSFFNCISPPMVLPLLKPSFWDTSRVSLDPQPTECFSSDLSLGTIYRLINSTLDDLRNVSTTKVSHRESGNFPRYRFRLEWAESSFVKLGTGVGRFLPCSSKCFDATIKDQCFTTIRSCRN